MPKKRPDPKVSERAQKALQNKPDKTALEDALAAANGDKTVVLVQFARQQFNTYMGDLGTWRENRRRYAQEAQDVFDHRVAGNTQDGGVPRLVFQLQNDSLNLVAALTEFASAQAEQDLFGGEPWFAAVPVGREDPALADAIQKHLQWSFRNGELVQRYCSAVARAACLGEVFTKTVYQIETDHFEETLNVLHRDGEPLKDGKNYITNDEQVKRLGIKARKGSKLTWKKLFIERDVVIKHGVETSLLSYTDVAFRADAPELDLKYTNFYSVLDISALEAKERFNLSLEDALRLALAANAAQSGDHTRDQATTVDSRGNLPVDRGNEDYGEEEKERLLNSRVRLVEGWLRIDPFGDGKARRLYIVFPYQSEDWLVYGDYLGNLSPKGELPVKCHVWEEVPGRLYGRGFFSKYAAVQTKIDDLWNQISYRNRMHCNPVGAFHPERLDRDDDEADLTLRPGDMLRIKGEWKLEDVLQFMQIPDLDERSMDLMQMSMQISQLRSGITSASQGDLSAVPENNTATGIRQLMSRAAVLMKKPVRGLRRSMGRDFSYAVKLFYANFDREEAFVWGEGETRTLLKITPEQVADLDIDVRMLLTQEQNQTKLEGSQAATQLVTQYIGLPEGEKPAARSLFVQGLKALEFDQAEEIIRQPNVSLEDTLAMLPPEQQQRLASLLQLEAQAAAVAPPNPAAPQAAPTQPAPQTAPKTSQQ